jgi:hypothetical protein
MSRSKKKPYTGAKAIDKSCRGGGDCPHCIGNRTIQAKRATQAAKKQLEDTPTKET